MSETVTLTGAHWERLLTAGRLRAWVEARQMGMTVEQCDRIADAAVAGVRELVKEWAQQQDMPPIRAGEAIATDGRCPALNPFGYQCKLATGHDGLHQNPDKEPT